mmetsp:Transcript_11671/g.31357  ORF Transcript_11671/g.31357 Transcript_11671/m.31357 type:complete len:413 (+) Transcript_11671:62-1300(+)
MPPRRPEPLSEEFFTPPVLLGSTNNGIPLPVKNTFLDVPSGFTPKSMKHAPAKMMSAPAEVKNAPGFLQRALEASVAAATAPQGAIPTALPSTPPGLESIASYTPFATPTPTGGSCAFPYWALAPIANEEQQMALAVGSRLAPPVGNLGHCLPVRSLQGPQSHVLAPAVASTRAPREEKPPQPTPWLWHDEVDDEASMDSEDGQSTSPEPLNAPRPPPSAVHPSIGSVEHAAGTCKRCCFFPRGRCTNGYNCCFCHYDHEKRKRKNKKKGKGATDANESATLVDVLVTGEQPRPGGLDAARSEGAAAADRGDISATIEANLSFFDYQAGDAMSMEFLHAQQYWTYEAQATVQSATQPATHICMLEPAVSRAAHCWALPPAQPPMLLDVLEISMPPPPMQSPKLQQVTGISEP